MQSDLGISCVILIAITQMNLFYLTKLREIVAKDIHIYFFFFYNISEKIKLGFHWIVYFF